MKKRFIRTMAFAFVCVLLLVGCADSSSDKSAKSEGKETLTIALQYGMAYAPLTIMQEKKLIEKNYNGELEIEWMNLNSGSAINEGFTSGNIDMAAMGIAPFITGAAKGIPYKMYGTISAQPHSLLTNQTSIQTIKDITSENKIALVNIGSIQHILLAMLAEKDLGDAHALDNHIVAMAHPDGMSALVAGSVDCQLTTSPYTYQAIESENVHEVKGLDEVWPNGNAFIVGLISDKLYEEQPELYDAIVTATQEAMDYIKENSEAAAILAKNQGMAEEDILTWLADPACVYDMNLPGVMDMAEFMKDNDFIDQAPESFESITTESARQG